MFLEVEGFFVLFCRLRFMFHEMFICGLIHGWGSKKRKKDSRTFVGLLFANNIYLKKN